MAGYRAGLVEQQDGACALCSTPFSEKNPPVLDHCHTTGQCRGAIHRGCNSMLGVIENNAPRYLLTNVARLARFLGNLIAYKFKDHGEVYYPTHRTDDEKRLLRNKRATAARKARKV